MGLGLSDVFQTRRRTLERGARGAPAPLPRLRADAAAGGDRHSRRTARRRADSRRAASADVELLESIALSVAPVVENARLYHDLRRSERFRDHVLDSMASALVAVEHDGRRS